VLVNVYCVMQCGYFSSMFNGQWEEADNSCVNINIPDDNVDQDGMITVHVMMKVIHVHIEILILSNKIVMLCYSLVNVIHLMNNLHM